MLDVSLCPSLVLSNLSMVDRCHVSMVKAIFFGKSVYTNARYDITTRGHKSKFGSKRFNTSPILIEHIPHIFGMGSKKQMIWPYAYSIVAFVTNFQRFIKFSIMNFIRQPVSIFLNALSSIHCDRKCSITSVTASLCSLPFPTSIQFENLFPKSFFNGFGGKCSKPFFHKTPSSDDGTLYGVI